MAPPVGLVDSRVAIAPGDPNYRLYVSDLLPHFDYSGREMPDATSSDTHAEA